MSGVAVIRCHIAVTSANMAFLRETTPGLAKHGGGSAELHGANGAALDANGEA